MDKYLKDIKYFNTLTFEEEQDLFEKYSNGNINARKKLIEHNLPMVIFIAKKYFNILDIEDLISIGNEELIKCIDKFDYKKEFKFNSYAFKCINGKIINFITSETKVKTEEIKDDITSIENEFFNYDIKFIKKLLNTLSEKEKYMIVEYYMNNKSFEEIGKKYNMKRQITKYYTDIAMEKLRKKIKNTNIKYKYGY